MFDELGDREREVLRAIVQEYIQTGGPVGSSQLARKAEFDVSSATMRNVMADLEALGFLEKPHTSAGRVPTDRGYRFYVDTMVKARDPALRDRELIESELSDKGKVESVLLDASRLLHFLTRHAGLVLAPRPAAAVLRRIEFVLLRENRVLAILVGQNGEVQNRAFTVDFPVNADELVKAGNFLSELLHQLPLEGLRARLQTELEQEKALYDVLASRALRLGMAATDLPPAERMLIEGTNTFLDSPDFADMERAKALFRALEEKGKLLSLLDQVERAREMQIFIGAESEFSAQGDVTVIATPYGSTDQVLGIVGVIGPTRMNYQRVIPLVNFTAQVVSRLLRG